MTGTNVKEKMKVDMTKAIRIKVGSHPKYSAMPPQTPAIIFSVRDLVSLDFIWFSSGLILVGNTTRPVKSYTLLKLFNRLVNRIPQIKEGIDQSCKRSFKRNVWILNGQINELHRVNGGTE